MAIDKAIDSAKEAACRTAEADAIREKLGSELPISYDFAGGRGFADAIEQIPQGGATEPYVEETLESVGRGLIAAHLHGYDFVRDYAFTGCRTLRSVEGIDDVTRIGIQAFDGCFYFSMDALPENLTRISGYAFRNCYALAIDEIPASVGSIDTEAFANCLSLTSLTFLTEDFDTTHGFYIAEDAFSGCINLTDIYVPWAEGDVRYAPWGATNATVHYAGGPSYEYITAIDPVAFPQRTGLKVVTLDGSESWSATGGGCYTSMYGDLIRNQTRAAIVGYCADYEFYPSITGLAELPQDGFMFNGTSSTPVNGNLSFKNEHTTSAAAWKAWLQEHPVTILISTNSPDASVWKPAKAPVQKWTIGGKTYTAIVPADTAKYPLTLAGWKMFEVSEVTTQSASSVVNIDTGYVSVVPSTCYCTDYEGQVNSVSVGSMLDKRAKHGFSTASNASRLYLKDTDVGTTVAEWNAYLADHPIAVLFQLATSDNSEWTAVTDGTTVGYLNPVTGEYCPVYGMTIAGEAERTGYWNGGADFVEVYGGIPYYGENLLTEELIQNFIAAWINTSYEWRLASDSVSVKIPVEVGKYYRMEWDFSAETGTVFRYGFCDIAEEPVTALSAPRARTSPADNPSVDVLASKRGLVIQASRVTTADPQSIRFRQLTVREMIGYTPPTLTMGGSPNPQPEPGEED